MLVLCTTTTITTIHVVALSLGTSGSYPCTIRRTYIQHQKPPNYKAQSIDRSICLSFVPMSNVLVAERFQRPIEGEDEEVFSWIPLLLLLRDAASCFTTCLAVAIARYL